MYGKTNTIVWSKKKKEYINKSKKKTRMKQHWKKKKEKTEHHLVLLYMYRYICGDCISIHKFFRSNLSVKSVKYSILFITFQKEFG